MCHFKLVRKKFHSVYSKQLHKTYKKFDAYFISYTNIYSRKIKDKT